MAKKKYTIEYTIGAMPTKTQTVTTLGEVRYTVEMWLKHAEQAKHGCVISISNEYAAEWKDATKLADAYDIDLCQDKDMALEDVEYAISTSEDIKRSEDLLKIKKFLMEKVN